MLYLKENPLLRETLGVEHIQAAAARPWGSDAGQGFTYIHFNRLINRYD
jgi:xylulose-5-phosphate/fructose-6-phosphate phosphoketolase